MLTKATGFFALAALLLGLAAGCAPRPAHAHELPHATFTGLDYAFESADTFEAGLITITLENRGLEPHHLQLARLQDGVTFETFVETLKTDGDAAFALFDDVVGGVGVLQPGKRQAVTVNLKKPGLYVAFCVISDAEGTPHFALGMIKPLEVVAAAQAERPHPPKADLTVKMLDFGYDVPPTVPAGKQVWKVVNHGGQPHELLVTKLAEGKTFEDVQAYFASGEAGPPPFTFAGGAQAMSVNNHSFVQFDFAEGDYLALCFVPDPATGKPHIALGMIRPFSVVAEQASTE